MSARTFTVATQITVLRLLFVPLFALLVINQRYRWALAVLGAAALSDVLDGTVARLFHQQSSLGLALDPIADKILMTTAYLALAFRNALPWWLTFTVISRDVIILLVALLIILVGGYRPFRPSLLGKASTAVQLVTILAALCRVAEIPLVSARPVRALIYLTAALTAASGLYYLLLLRGYGASQAASANSR